MRLSVKILIIICIIFLGMVALLYGVTNKVVLGSFAQLEEKDIQTNLKRALNVLDKDMSGLKAIGGDWGAWDETKDFLKDLNEKYKESNLTLSTFSNLNINYVLYFNNSGGLIYSAGFQFGKEPKETPVPADLINQVKNQRAFFTHADAKDAKTGIILLPDDMVMITAWPISNNDMDGPVSGTIVMGRDFDDNELKSLEQRTQLKLILRRNGQDRLPDDFISARGGLSKDEGPVINHNLPDVISGYSFIKDIYGEDSLILRVSTSRDIYKQGKITTNYFLWMQIIVGIILMAGLFLTLQLTVLNPVLRLKRHVLSVGKTGDLSSRLLLKNKDELGTLAREFNRMLEQLSDVRNRLIEQSYYSGVGEMASGVLHNIRNVLTPMVGRLAAMRNRLKGAPLDNMEQAILELKSGDLEAGREGSLKTYLHLAAPKLKTIIKDLDNDLVAVSGQVNHIEEVLSQQDKFSHFHKALEPLHINEVFEDAAKMMPQNLREAVDIESEPGLIGLPPVSAERVVLTQVFTNLLNNSSESILKKGTERGKIWVSGSSEAKDADTIHIVIKDNGEGIDEESLKRIFTRGFSTKTPNASGIGLHWCSNALTAIGASIYAESEGPGQGSSFHIKIPRLQV
jgi:two-component system, NtrC family, sensor kinase